ncbi:hypothetical protein [Pseudomonas aeruginosa]|uniref:hypothetical protein n=1 Tax=Pseudomonas aeruginosa TaxID=287 RepID=UPI000AA3A21C|nr:hypothetical protein [Pseudomonas aeruginosa]
MPDAITLCHLCGLHPAGEQSHIIPRFVSTRIAQDCGGFSFREASNPNKVVQNTITFPLLCADCEDLFWKWEDIFSRETFRPYFDNDEQPVIFDRNTFDLMISICWRVLKYTLLAHPPAINFSYLNDAEKIWRDYLLAKRTNVATFQPYLVLDRDFSNSVIQNSAALTRTHLRNTIAQGIFGVPAIDLPGVFRHVVYAKLGPFILFGVMFSSDEIIDQNDSWQAVEQTVSDKVRQNPEKLPTSIISHVDVTTSKIIKSMELLSDKQKIKQNTLVTKKLHKAPVRHLVNEDKRLFPTDSTKDN